MIPNTQSTVTSTTILDEERELLRFGQLANEQLNSTVFMKLRLKPGFTPFNIICYYILCFTIGLVLQFLTVQITYILKDKDFYNEKPTEVAKIAGECGSLAQIFAISLDLLLGLIFDTIGRKIPLILGLFTTGMSIGLAPFPHEVVPFFVILRVLMTVGIIPGLNTPLLPDYVHPKSLGLANAYVIQFPFIFIVKRNWRSIFNLWHYSNF